MRFLISKQKKQMIKPVQVVSTPNIMSGKPCIKGTRIPASTIVYLVRTEKINPNDLIQDYFPQLSLEAVNAALSWSDSNKELAYE